MAAPSVEKNSRGRRGYRVPYHYNGKRGIRWHEESDLLCAFLNKKRLHGPEHDLLFAVLSQAITDAAQEPETQRCHTERARIRRQRATARAFFIRGDFVPYAELLGINPIWLLRLLADHSGWFRKNPYQVAQNAWRLTRRKKQ